MSRTGTWELLGQLLSAGAAFFDLAYIAPQLATIGGVFRGTLVFSTTPAAAVGLAGLGFSSLASFVGVVLGQLRESDDIGAALMSWVAFAVLVVGGVGFYSLTTSSVVVLLIGGASGVLSALGVLIISQRRRSLF